MARRNIFDRDTGAGYYSDSLGNFLESIPSLYGQIAKEKRLEKQHIEDTNYRNQAYNDQLMQQAKTNIRNTESDRRAADWQNFQKEDKEFKSRLEMAKLASINNPGAVDSFLLNEGVITQEDFNSRKTTNNDYNDLITDADSYINMTINDQFDNYHDGTDMYNRINTKLSVLPPNSPKAKTLRDEKNKLNKALNFVKSKSGKVKSLSEWSNPEDAVLHNQLTLDLKDYNKRLRDVNSQIIKAESTPGYSQKLLKASYAQRDSLQKAVKDSFGKSGYAGSIPNTIRDISMIGAKYKYPSIPDKPLPGQDTGSSGLADVDDDERAKIIEERNEFINSVEPLIRNDKTGVGYNAILDYYRDDGDESFSKIKDIAGVLAKKVEAKAPQIIGIAPPSTESKDLVGILPIPDTQPEVIEPVIAKTEPAITEDVVVEDEIIEKDINEGGELTLPPVVPTLSAAQQKIEDIGVPIRTVDDVFNESGKIKEDAAKYDIEPLSEPTRLDNKNGKKRNESSKYMIKKLQPDLERLRDLRNYVERDKKKKSYNASSLDARRRNQTISQIENLIKKNIGQYINPVSGEISMSDKGFKESLLKRLSKEFGDDLQSLLASLSIVQRIN